MVFYFWVPRSITITRKLLAKFIQTKQCGSIYWYKVCGYEYPKWDDKSPPFYVPRDVTIQDFHDVLIFTKSTKTSFGTTAFLNSFVEHCQVYTDKRNKEYYEKEVKIYIMDNNKIYDDAPRLHDIVVLGTCN